MSYPLGDNARVNWNSHLRPTEARAHILARFATRWPQVVPKTTSTTMNPNITSTLIALILASFSTHACAQPAAASATPCAIVERGPHHRVWQRVTYAPTRLGAVIAQTNACPIDQLMRPV